MTANTRPRYCGVTGTHSPTSVCGAELPCPIHDDEDQATRVAVREALADLRERCEKTDQTLAEIGGDHLDADRLKGKREGVRLALSYINEAERAL